MNTDEIRRFYDVRGQSALEGGIEVIPTYLCGPYDFALETLQDRLPAGASVLDFACGTGIHTLAIAQAGLCPTGIDLSPSSIEAARKRLDNAGFTDLKLKVGDQSHAMLSDNSFDAIFVSGALYYLDPQKDGQHFHRILKNGGIIVAVETQGDNAILNIYRRIRNWMRPYRDTQTLDSLWRKPQFQTFCSNFEHARLFHFDFLTLVAGKFKSFPRFQNLYVRLARALDSHILRLAPPLSFKIVVIAEKSL